MLYKIINNQVIPLTDEEMVIHFIKQFNIIKSTKLQAISKYVTSKPIVSITITDGIPAMYDSVTNEEVSSEVPPVIIHVDGGRNNKDDFKTNWELMSDTDTTVVKDAYNQFHQGITKVQMEKIWKGIVKNGILLYQRKWEKEAEINAIKLEDYTTAEDAVNAIKAIEV